jgi:hypothetical protein
MCGDVEESTEHLNEAGRNYVTNGLLVCSLSNIRAAYLLGRLFRSRVFFSRDGFMGAS